MRTTSRAIAAALAGALLLTSLPVAQAASSQKSGPGLTQAAATATDISARRRHRGNSAAALAAFGLIAGTIATIAANQERRDYYERYGGYGYGGGYGYYGPPRPYYGYGHRGYRYW